jgi:hypothetical protein
VTVSDWARTLYIVGAALATAGPAIAAVRAARRHVDTRDDDRVGTWSDPAIDPEEIRSATRRDGWWGVAEFGLVGSGVVCGMVASLLLVP